VIWDAPDLLESRVMAMRELPWVIPALTVIRMTDEDLDLLDAAYDSPEYWSVLNRIVRRIESDRKETK
jgi:hypothetical protein